MFQLTTQQARLASATPRNEFHGDETELKLDLKFTVDLPNGVLREFHSDLAQALFRPSTGAQQQLNLDEVAPLTEIRFPNLGELKWAHAHAGYSLRLHLGLRDETDVQLKECDFDKVGLTPVEGGTVQVAFRVIAKPEIEDIGRICALAQKPVTISLLPPQETVEKTQGDLLNEAAGSRGDAE